MPWSNQSGGGPWGQRGGSGGGKSPWGSGGPQGNGTPPDLEDILRRGQDRLKDFIPGGSMGGKGLIILALGVLAVWLLTGFYTVRSSGRTSVPRTPWRSATARADRRDAVATSSRKA